MKDCQRPKHPPDALGAVKYCNRLDVDDALELTTGGVWVPTADASLVHISEFLGKSSLHPRRRHLHVAMLFLESWVPTWMRTRSKEENADEKKAPQPKRGKQLHDECKTQLFV